MARPRRSLTHPTNTSGPRNIAAAIAGGFRDEGVPLTDAAFHPTASREPHQRTA